MPFTAKSKIIFTKALFHKTFALIFCSIDVELIENPWHSGMMKLKLLSLFSILILALAILFFNFLNTKNKYLFYNGNIFTAADTIISNEAVLVENGKIVFVGKEAIAKKRAGLFVRKINLNGNTLMPGLVDAHMHPQSAGLKMLMCNLNYEPLTIEQMNSKIQKCLDREANAKPDDWLVIINWFEQEMLPKGYIPTFRDFESLNTKRPIYVKNSFGHAGLLNKRGMEIVNLKSQKEREGGKIVRDKNGEPTGRLEDAARDIISEILPQPSAQENLLAAERAQKHMNQQGVTTILDAYTDIETMQAYKSLYTDEKLSLRPHFAVLIDPAKETDNSKSIAELIRQKQMFDQGAPKPEPSLSVHTAKIFLDGTVALPSKTGNLLEPYWENHGTEKTPHWQPSNDNGPDIYVSKEALIELMLGLNDLGIDSHMHADGDGAVNFALNAIEEAQKQRPNFKTRPAIAHCELVSPNDYSRFAKLNALPVLSFQWGKPAADTWEGSKDILGPKRHAVFEPQGLLHNAGAKIVFGSDWPVDPLNQWLALQVAITRQAIGEDKSKYPMRLGVDPALKLNDALKAMTINAAYSLHMESYIGSIEVGKFADLIILDRNIFKTPPTEIANTKVRLTMLGGKIIYKE